LTSLNLSDCGLLPHHLISLLQGLVTCKRKKGLQHLSLAGNDLSTIPDQLLADGFTHLEHSLNLSRCRLSSDQVKIFLNSNVIIFYSRFKLDLSFDVNINLI